MSPQTLFVFLAILGACYWLWWKFQELKKESHLLFGLPCGVLAEHPEALEDYRRTVLRHEMMGSDPTYKAGYGGNKSEMERQIKAMRSAVSVAEHTRR